jgi:hypothetical protein
MSTGNDQIQVFYFRVWSSSWSIFVSPSESVTDGDHPSSSDAREALRMLIQGKMETISL